MLQFIMFSYLAASSRAFLSCLCGLCASLILLEEAWASGLPARAYNVPQAQTLSSSNYLNSSSTAMLGQKDLSDLYQDDKAKAMEAISGSKHPGVIEHFLIRPLPEKNHVNSKLSIMLSYPSIGRQDVDTDIRHWITEIADSFENHFDSDLLNFNDTFNEYNSSVDNIELHAVYDISQPSPKALSITFEVWNKISNNHSNLDVLTLNYSLINGQRLQLSDIFAKPDQALKIMSSLSRRILNDRYGLGRKQMVDNGTEPLVENFSSLTLTPKGICINFQPYQVASWELGIQKVEIALEDLKSAQPFTALWGR